MDASRRPGRQHFQEWAGEIVLPEPLWFLHPEEQPSGDDVRFSLTHQVHVYRILRGRLPRLRQVLENLQEIAEEVRLDELDSRLCRPQNLRVDDAGIPGDLLPFPADRGVLLPLQVPLWPTSDGPPRRRPNFARDQGKNVEVGMPQPALAPLDFEARDRRLQGRKPGPGPSPLEVVFDSLETGPVRPQQMVDPLAQVSSVLHGDGHHPGDQVRPLLEDRERFPSILAGQLDSPATGTAQAELLLLAPVRGGNGRFVVGQPMPQSDPGTALPELLRPSIELAALQPAQGRGDLLKPFSDPQTRPLPLRPLLQGWKYDTDVRCTLHLLLYEL